MKGCLGRNSSVLWDFEQNFKQSLPKVRLSLWPKLQKASCVANDPPSPKFDLEASSFPPLPGCVDCIQGETTQEMRLSDVVRGLKVPNKVKLVSLNISYTRREYILYCYCIVFISVSWGPKHKDLRRRRETRFCGTGSWSCSSGITSLKVGLARVNEIK